MEEREAMSGEHGRASVLRNCIFIICEKRFSPASRMSRFEEKYPYFGTDRTVLENTATN